MTHLGKSKKGHLRRLFSMRGYTLIMSSLVNSSLSVAVIEKNDRTVVEGSAP